MGPDAHEEELVSICGQARRRTQCVIDDGDQTPLDSAARNHVPSHLTAGNEAAGQQAEREIRQQRTHKVGRQRIDDASGIVDERKPVQGRRAARQALALDTSELGAVFDRADDGLQQIEQLQLVLAAVPREDGVEQPEQLEVDAMLEGNRAVRSALCRARNAPIAEVTEVIDLRHEVHDGEAPAIRPARWRDRIDDDELGIRVKARDDCRQALIR